jgi:hypothetical protein
MTTTPAAITAGPYCQKNRYAGKAKTMAVLCKLIGKAMPYRCGDCMGFCIDQPAMTVAALTLLSQLTKKN